MTALFRKKELCPSERICLRLKGLRKSKNISLSLMSEKTKISTHYLEALESCRFDILPPAAIYQKNFVKAYLEALGVNPAPYLSQFEDEEAQFLPISELQHPTSAIKARHFHNIPLLFRFGAVFLLLALFAGYLGFQIKHIIEPPELTLLSPQNGLVSDRSHVVIEGHTDQEVRVSINGTEIGNNDKGKFEETLSLSPGLNTIVVTAEKKHGGSTTETRYVVLRENNQES